MGELQKTASSIRGMDKPKQKSIKRGNSISNLAKITKSYRDERSTQSRGSTREGRSKHKPASASQSRTGTDFKRGRTLTPTARNTTKYERFPKPEPLSLEEQAVFDEKREEEVLAEAAAKKERAKAIRERQEKQLEKLKAKMDKEKADKDAEE